MARRRPTADELEEFDPLDEFTARMQTALEQRKGLSAQSVQRLYSRKALEQGFLECFELVGGVPRLAIWANDPRNYAEFLKLLMKFAPKDATEQVGRVLEYRSNVPTSPLNRPAHTPEGEQAQDAELIEYDGDV